MTIKSRIVRLEAKQQAQPQKIEMSSEWMIEHTIQSCVDRYGFSRDETIKRLEPEITEMRRNPIFTIYESGDDWTKGLTEEELEKVIAELDDKLYLEFFTDTKSGKVPSKTLKQAIDNHAFRVRMGWCDEYGHKIK